jgi:hypothetical protein
MVQPWPNHPAVVDSSNLLTGVRSGLLIEAGVVALIVLLHWLF